MSGDTMDMLAAEKKLSIASRSAKLTSSGLKPMWPVGSGGPSNKLAGLGMDVMGETRKSEAVGSWGIGACLCDANVAAEREDVSAWPLSAAFLTAEAALVG